MSNCCSINKVDKNSPDILVIGAGSAGFSAAITAAEMGKTVVIAGEGTIGGTCVNVGCVPSKTMIRATETVYQAHNAKRFDGIEAKAEITNWKALIAQKQKLVNELRDAKYINVLPSYPNILYIAGRAVFEKDAVRIDDTLYTPQKIIIATGSSSSLPPINGIQSVKYLDSTAALELETLPKSILIIGGGVIGVELGQMFSRAGSKVTICCRSRLLPQEEPEISEGLKKYLEDEGITVCTGISYQKIEEDAEGILLTCNSIKNNNKNHCDTLPADKIITAEKLIIATGRKPNTDNMGLENVGVKLTKNGGIKVDEYMRSTNPNIYAAGDVTGTDMFVYMAAYGAKLAANNAVNGNAMSYNSSLMPAVVFTDPQVASVGITESKAEQQGYSVKTSTITLNYIPRYIAARDTRGLIKLVADKKTDKILGAHILAPEAVELIQSIVMAMKGNLTTKDLAETIFPYLTGVEGLKLAAQNFNKDVSKLSCCAG